MAAESLSDTHEVKVLENCTAWDEFVDFTCWAGVEVLS
jgi:hypothetical protein